MNIIAFDTETKGLDWFDPAQHAFLATWTDGEREYCADLSNEDQVRKFREAIDLAEVVIGHNLKFDAHQVRATLGFDPTTDKICHDTDLMSRVFHPEGANKGSMGGHGLKNLAKVYLRADADEAEQAIDELAKSIGYRSGIKPPKTHKGPWLAYYDVYRAYPEALVVYAVMDARFTYDLFAKWSREYDL